MTERAGPHHRDEDGFFDPAQRATIAAAMERIIPSDDTPGAREAGTIDFLDRYLSGLGRILAKPDGSGFETLTGPAALAWGQRLDAIRARYVAGIADLEARSQAAFGVGFASLDDDGRDAILTAVEGRQDTGVAALQQTNAEIDLDFFGLLCLHTRQGFYADPIYGGNRGRIGWEVIGFPGPASLAEVHAGRYSTLDWFAEDRVHPGTEASA